MTPLINAHQELFRRYNQLAQVNKDSLPSEQVYRIHMMGIHAISHDDMYLEKLSEWLGFVQGILYANGIINIDEERKFSEILLERAYKEMKVKPPNKIDIYQQLLDSWD